MYIVLLQQLTVAFVDGVVINVYCLYMYMLQFMVIVRESHCFAKIAKL